MQVNQKEVITLQSLSKSLYEKMLIELGKSNIHSYDVQASVICSSESYEFIISFGDQFRKKETKQFSKEEVENMDHSVLTFFKETGEKIKETLIQEYYKMMKP